MRQLHAAGNGRDRHFYGNEVCHDEPSEYQEQRHPHGDKPGDGAYRELHFGRLAATVAGLRRRFRHSRNPRQGRQGGFISGSKSSIWLHEESNSGIPHLHAIVSRVDEKGNINNDHAIHLRAQRAAEKVARQRGWTTAQHIHETNIPKVSADCMEALRELDKWSWDGYQERLTAKGYELYLRKDKKDVIRGYVLLKGNTKFKASELGKGRNLTASRIKQTWEKLHSDKTQQVRPATKQPVVSTPKPSVPNGTRQKPQPVIRQNNPIFENYTTYKPNSQPTEFEHDGKTYNRYLPDKVLDFFNDEFDYRELANWQDLQNLAMAYFTLITSPYEVTSGDGGGGSQSDLKWGRDPKEDEIEFARRCAQAASNRIGRHSKGGIKRK